MTTADEKQTAEHVWDPEHSAFPAPDLGRTVHVVGPVVNVDPQTLPHPMNQRGELGKALYNWRHNTISNDPLVRIAFDNHSADRNHVINTVMRRFPKGAVNRDRTEVKDPAVMSRHIKRVARHFGMDIVGIGQSHPSFLFAGRPSTPCRARRPRTSKDPRS